MKYSKEVMEIISNPHNMGRIERPDGIGTVGNPVCGDMMTIMITIKEDRIEDIKFETSGCGAAIAVSSVVTDMAKGKAIKEALKITNQMVAGELGELPKNELHCSNLGAEALHEAITDYLRKQEGITSRRPDQKVEHFNSHTGQCHCPYCDVELSTEAPFCGNCGKPTTIRG